MALDEFGFLINVHKMIKGIDKLIPSSMFEDHAKVNFEALKEYIGNRLEQMTAKEIDGLDEDCLDVHTLENKNNES